MRICTERLGDTVARMGGDEFAVILNSIDSSLRPELVAQRILDSLQQPVRVNEHDLLVTGSIGIACFPRAWERPWEPRASLGHRDVQRKASGRNVYRVYNAAHAEGFQNRLVLERHLRQAVHDRAFRLDYQPQCLPDGRLIGMEALLRWISP